MNELYEKLDNLKKELDNLDLFKKIEDSIKKIESNKGLMAKIEKFNKTKNNDIRLDIYKYDEIKEYKELENEVNLLILQINTKLKKIKDTRSCCHENN